ncbi:MAG TPA: hypothetical protein VNI52_10010 [Sphingobacteriaceae bacterium]|nr:hypothetical protein [Sphingobacteriaceae bacterium]
MKKLFLVNLVALAAVYFALLLFSLYVLPHFKLTQGWEFVVIFVIGILLYILIFYLIKASAFKFTLQGIFFIFLINLSCLLTSQYHNGLKKRVIIRNNVHNLPGGSYYLKVKDIQLNTAMIGHSFNFVKKTRGGYNYFNHYFTIPVISDSGRLYKNWVIIKKVQRVNQILINYETNNKFKFFKDYYLDSLSHLNTYNIKFYKVNHYNIPKDEKLIMIKSALATSRADDEIRMLEPHFIDYMSFDKQQNEALFRTILFTIFFIALAALVKAGFEFKPTSQPDKSVL